MTPDDDSLLVELHARMRAGDADAANGLIRLLYPRVGSDIRRRLRGYPPDLLADAVQEAMIAVAAHLPSCYAASGRQVMRWVAVVGWHAALRYMRSPGAGLRIGWNAVALDTSGAVHDAPTSVGDDAVRLTLSLALSTVPAAPNTGSGVVSPAPSAGLQELARALATAWPALGAANAALVWDRAATGRSYAELAAAYGTTPEAAKRRCQRAVATLRRSVRRQVDALREPARSRVLRRMSADPDDG